MKIRGIKRFERLENVHEKYSVYYDINKCQFGARIVNRTGDSECELNIVDEDNKTDYIDCELIGYRQFNNLLNDLKVIGKESKPIKIKMIEKGDGN